MASNGLRDQALAEKVSESVIWVRFGFVFEGRAIVFNNLLASFVQITSFFSAFRLRCLPSQGNSCRTPLGTAAAQPQPRACPRDPVTVNPFCFLCRFPDRPRS